MDTLYPFSDSDVTQAFETLAATLFDTTRDTDCDTCPPAPKLLIVAGAQGSGKTYLLENSLLPSGRYDNYVRLYLSAFRELHPHYAAMQAHGTLHVYEHTEAFVWALGGRVFQHAFDNHFNIIMESALDSPLFAQFPPAAVEQGYQFEVHMIACQKAFSHWSTLDRCIKSLARDELERFVPLSSIEASQLNARAILDAFENACLQVPGSQITLYHRGFDTELQSQPLCHSRCLNPSELLPQADYRGVPFITLPQLNPSFEIRRDPQANAPCSYLQYAQVVHAGIIEAAQRQHMVQACCNSLARAQAQMPKVPASVFRELSLYVLTYVYP
ncbi:zeta toxin family protein [Pseudomonas cremoricolorata]|uniref:zeta toxin family protein n=1 Tax=Pseudomonas cremoricolorata TaxID=157783 RepID=UPI00040DA4A5|nr:zeta toxin family protein [Pseudomonas cremoricolorata]